MEFAGTAAVEESVSRAHRLMVVAAHPDDETLGAAWWMSQATEVMVVYATDGAPEHRQFVPDGAPFDRQAYADMRLQEASAALYLAGVRQAEALGIPDLEASYYMADLARLLCARIKEFRPDVVVSHAYEGGHPDHDAVAFAAAWARRRMGPEAPAHWEMALYHGGPGHLVRGQFISGGDSIVLPSAILERKRRMISCFTSQKVVIDPFTLLERECYRVAPKYRFELPPHDGPLWYERLAMPMDRPTWRALVAEAEAALKPRWVT